MFNLLMTMLLGGLWHGAAGNFILWGAFHGGLLAVARPLRGLSTWMDAGKRRVLFIAVRRLFFFHLICLGWALFRAKSLDDCAVLFEKMLWPEMEWAVFWEGVVAANAQAFLGFVGACIVGVVGWQLVWPTDSKRITALLWRTPEPVRFAVVVGLLYCAMLFAPEQPPPFIYFQF